MRKIAPLAIALTALVLVGAGCMPTKTAAPAPAPQAQNTNAQALATAPKFEVAAEDVAYAGDAKGYYAHPKEAGTYPGVVMVHEWWGLNDHIKDMARQLAGEGYHVFAVDLYHQEVAATPERARELVTALKQDEALTNMRDAVGYLRGKQASKIASLGWCFGGGQSLQLALSGEKLDATVIYYGTLVTDRTKLQNIHWPVLGVFGSKDQSIPVAKVEEFKKTLDEVHVPNEIKVYDGVGHAFANPSGQNYAPQETLDAWSRTTAFLRASLD